jgi:hypothetical protein
MCIGEQSCRRRQTARFPSPSSDWNDGHHSIVSQLVSLIENIQAGMKLLEATIDTETAPGNQDAASDVFVLDNVTTRYVKANAIAPEVLIRFPRSSSGSVRCRSLKISVVFNSRDRLSPSCPAWSCRIGEDSALRRR